MAAIENDWLPALRAEFKKPYYAKLYHFIEEEYRTETVYPAADRIFEALTLTPLEKVRVVILGQDPYHEPNQAHGLAFSVLPTQPVIPPSLKNIYRELHDELGCYIPNNGYLKKWAEQGVLLLNTVLTVRAHVLFPTGIRAGSSLPMRFSPRQIALTIVWSFYSGGAPHRKSSRCLIHQDISY